MKINYEYVKKFFRDKNCELIEKEYINARNKMLYRCVCGNINKISWMKFRIGHRCAKCAKLKCGQYKKHTIEYVKKYFEMNGCELLETHYVNSNEKMKYKCICGKSSEINFNNFKLGKRCCGIKKAGLKRRLKYEDVSSYFKANGCELLEQEYKSVATLMLYKCSCGNISKIRWNSFKNGGRCRLCKNKKISIGNTKYTYSYIKYYFNNNECVLLTTEDDFANNKNKVSYKCKCGKEWKTSFSDFKKNNITKKCKICSCPRGDKHWNWNPDRDEVKLRIKIVKKVSKMLHTCLKAMEKEKIEKTEHLLGFTRKDLKNRLQNHPNWDNVKNGGWEIDHVFPINAFIKYKIYDLKIINSLENLRPISKKENMSKSDYFNYEDFIFWLINLNLNSPYLNK